MRRNEAVAQLKATESELRKFGISALYLFGSHARDQAGPNSDVDVFVDFEIGCAIGFLTYMDAFATLRDRIDANIDYGTRSGLHPYCAMTSSAKPSGFSDATISNPDLAFRHSRRNTGYSRSHGKRRPMSFPKAG